MGGCGALLYQDVYLVLTFRRNARLQIFYPTGGQWREWDACLLRRESSRIENSEERELSIQSSLAPARTGADRVASRSGYKFYRQKLYAHLGYHPRLR